MKYIEKTCLRPVLVIVSDLRHRQVGFSLVWSCGSRNAEERNVLMRSEAILGSLGAELKKSDKERLFLATDSTVLVWSLFAYLCIFYL